MVLLSSLTSIPCLPTAFLFLKHSLPAYNTHNYFPNFKYPPSNTRRFSRYSIHTNLPVPNNDPKDPYPPSKLELRTLYPGGFKRPEIKVPSIVLQLTVDEVLSDGSVLDVVDEAVCKWVGIVVVMGGEGGGGGRLYQAACWLKSVIRDRAYLLIAERVDIAAAVNASGVVLSDQGLPTIVARNTLMGSKSESVILPVVGRCVQTVDAAVSASKSEGADFLIYSTAVEEHNVPIQSLCANVKAPIFTTTTLNEDTVSFDLASSLLRSGASGLVITLRTLKLSMGDTLSKLLSDAHATNNRSQDKVTRVNKFKMLDVIDDLAGEKGVAGFVKLEHREVQFIKKERWILLEAINVIQKAAPLMEEASLLKDAVAQLDEPFLLVIVGEFNSGKSTVINALLGGRFLKDGVVPTTNEITFLRYSECDSNEQQRFERHPDGRFICYLPAQILKDMVIVDTPGTNVILQRQQRLTEEFVPRADLLLFVISADRPLTESEVTFLRYTQQWKKKVIFVLNKSDLYQNASELKEAVTFVKENIQRLLNAEHVTLYPVSARSALEAKILSSDVSRDYTKLSMTESYQSIQNFFIFEKFLFSFLDGSTSNGLERIKIKLETPIRIAERLLSACQTVVTQDSRYAQQDLASLEELFNSVKQYSMKMESESNSWRRRILTLVDTTEARVLKLVESTLQLSNLDLAASFVFKGKKSASMPATLSLQNDIIGPMLWDAQKLLGEYSAWLRTSTTCEAKQYKESLKKRWPSFFDAVKAVELESNALIKVDDLSLKSIEKYNATAASKLFDQEIREVFLGAFGGLGAAGLSASLLTSVLPTTLEDLLALGLCSAGGLLAIWNFPARRQRMVDKVKHIADAVACEVEGAMEEELSETIKELNNLVQVMGKPYQEAAQDRVDKLAEIQGELSDVGRKLLSLQIELQNFHLS